MNDALIEIKDLRKSFQGQPVLRGVDLAVPEGRITLIIGKSGEGKSVLLKHIVGLLTPDSGDILFQGQPLAGLRRTGRGALARTMSFMFQNMALFDSLTVFENIALPLREKTRLPEKDIAARVMDKVERLELGAVTMKYPSQISGGMQKRVALARALVNEPRVILFDEPTTGLDPIRKNAVLSLIAQSREAFGFTALMVSHDIPDVFRIAAKVAMLDAGRIVFEGSPEEIQATDMPVVTRFLAGEEEPETTLEGAA
jgi:phospholipid/cholesterol/gamma-HCH transport system ATP-binding protein